MKTLDVQGLHNAIDQTLEQLKKQSDEIAKVKKSVDGITSLDDALKGKGGDAIRAFYEECHTPFLRFYETFIEEYESALKKIKNALNSLEPNHNGYISQAFLEHDLEQGLNAADRTTKHLVSKANATIAKVSHIVDLPDLNDNDFHEQNQKALKEISTTLEKLHAFDREQTNALKTAKQDLETMQKYITRLEKMYTGPKIEIAGYQKGSILKPDEMDSLQLNEETPMEVMLDKLENKSELEKEISEVDEQDIKLYKLKKKLENASDSEEYIKIAKEIGYENLDSDQKLYVWLLEKKKYIEFDSIGFVGGVKDNLVDTGIGLWDSVTHPKETLEGIGNAIIHPVDTFNIIKKDIEESFERDVINGDSYSRSHWFGYALTTVGTSIVGSKGADKLSKVSKAGKIGKAGSKVKAATKQATSKTIKVSKEALEKNVASFKKSMQRVASKIKGIHIHNPFAPQIQLAGGGKVPYHVIEGENFKKTLIQRIEKVFGGEKGAKTAKKVSKVEKLPNNFADKEKLVGHFKKHGKEFRGMYRNADEYLKGAQDLVKNGIKVQYRYKVKGGNIEIRTGYVKFMGNKRKGGEAKFAFVGTNNQGYITTYHVESGKDFWKMLNDDKKKKVINPVHK
ncbi:LXG domain-containing protein [Bacillus swezeyi]|uniref:LXG domain-containing protein n=1 Tax=Bacillus swezeyi TaxID=1925020 RepID=A0A1R1Q7B1_9BACI|nr:T7SS effector LXG polymorphic toxin [Bacillus swezeyi]MEC1261889.1 LXG domain-containing protein [Bacillus swezeyi]MED2930278.1 LXG domain-containing protein [Bacillus swezeyi]MED2966189.1 LXG domain-containing protein [Bacillus swezeyi]MED3072776.1 LXG domain-containing protein [Bacillus swezeyi]MED3080375.1 LXG domain-containing protein [Bacillus swezeyi]